MGEREKMMREKKADAKAGRERYRTDTEKWRHPRDGDEIRFRVGDEIPGTAWSSRRDKRTGEIVLRFSFAQWYENWQLELFENEMDGYSEDEMDWDD